ncbi:hypothetical protein ACWX7F_002916 [Acinetobacter baumannii]
MDINQLLSWGDAVSGQTLKQTQTQDATLRNQAALAQAASSSKYASLQAERAGIAARQDAIQKHAMEQEKNWVQPTDAELQQGGLPGLWSNGLNTALSTFDGASHYLGQAIGSVYEGSSMVNGLLVTDKTREAYGRYKANQATPEDMKLLNAEAPRTLQRPLARSFLDVLNESDETHNIAGKFFGNKREGKPGLLDTDMYNQYHAQQREMKLKELNDAVDAKYLGRLNYSKEQLDKMSFTEKLSLLKKAGGNVLAYSRDIAKNAFGANLDNKWALAGDLAGSVPYMLGGGVGVAIGAGAQTMEDAHHSIDQYVAREGHLPTAEDQLKMAGVGAVNFGANYLENILPVKALGWGARSAEKGSKASIESMTASLKAARGMGDAAKLAAVAGGAGVANAIGSGIQDSIQRGWGSLDSKDVSVRSFIESAIQGGLVGGGAVAGGAVAGRVGATVKDAAAQGAQALNKRKEAAQAKTDYDTLINPESEYFDPAQAINTQVQAFHAEGATPEQQQQARERMDQAIQVAEDTFGQKEADLTTAMQRHEELVTELNETAAVIKDQMKATQDPEAIAEMKEDLAEVEKELKTATEQKASVQKDLEQIQQSRQAVYEARDRFDDQEANLTGKVDTPEAIKKTVDTLTAQPDAEGKLSVTPEQIQEAATKLKKNPMLVEPEQLKAIADNEHNGLSQNERGLLRRLADHQITLNQAKDADAVSKEIVEGGKSFRGLDEYTREVTKALGQDRTKVADRFLKELDNFQAHYEDKASVAEAALKESKQLLDQWKKDNPDQPVPEGAAQLEIYKDQKNGKWFINRGEVQIDPKQREEFGSLYINANAPKSAQLVSQIREDAKQVAQAHSLLNDMRNNYAPSKGIGDVPVENTNQVPNRQSEVTPTPKTAENPRAEQKSNQRDGQAKPVGAKPEVKPEETAKPKAEDSRKTAQNEPQAARSKKDDESHSPEVKTPENAKQSESSDTKGKGRIRLLDQVKHEDRVAENQKPFTERNLVRASFVQKSGEGHLNPLTEVADFISHVKSAENPREVLQQFYKKEISDKQMAHFVNFSKYTDKFKQLFDKAFLYYPNAEYHHSDYMQYLAEPTEDGKAKFDENVMTAMAHSAFTWVAENGNQPWATDDRILENVFHFNNVENMTASPDIQKEFRLSSSFTSMASEIGSKAMQALNLRLDDKLDIDPSRKAKLETAMGGYIIHALEHQGVLKVQEYTNAQMANFARQLGEGRYTEFLNNQLGLKLPANRAAWTEKQIKAVQQFETSKKVNQKFVSLVRNGDNVPEGVKRIMDSAKDTKGFLSDLFRVERYNRPPSTEKPKDLVQNRIKNTDQGIPSHQRELLKKAQQHEQRVRVETLDPVAHLYKNHREEMLHLFDLRTDKAWLERNFHVKERESVAAKRQNVLRNLELALEFTGEYLERKDNEYQPFYTEFEVWQPQRMGVTNNMMNTQSNTVHRALATPAGFKMEIETPKGSLLEASFDKNGQLTSLGNFLRAVAEGAEDMKLDLPGEYRKKSFDKVKPEEYLPVFIDWMESPEVQKAIAATTKLRTLSAEGKPIPKEVFRDIKPVLDQMGNGFMEFNSLIAMSELYSAIESKQDKFTSYMRAGSDGVTSGSAISHLMTATVDASTGTNDMAHGFGFITKEGHDELGLNDIFDVNASGVGDIYHTVNDFQNKRWVQVFSGQSGLMSHPFTNEVLGEMFRSMNNLFRDFTDRNKGKASATPTIYGSSAGAIKANVADQSISKIYSIMRDLQKKYRSNPEAAMQEAQARTLDMNYMLQYYNNFLVPAKPDTYMNTKYQDENGKTVTAVEYFGPKMEAEYNMNNPDNPISFANMEVRDFLAKYAEMRKPETKKDNQIWFAAISRYNKRRLGNKPVDYLPDNFLDPSTNLLNKVLPADVEQALQTVAYNVHGKIHELALDDAYRDYLQIRNVDVAMIDVSYNIYKEAKEQLIQEAMAKALDPDSDGPKVAFRVDKQTGEKIPLEGLPPSVMKDIEKKLFTVRPVVASSLSTVSKDQLGTGLMMATQAERFLSDSAHKVQIQGMSTNKKMTSQLGTRAPVDGDPGVRGAVIPVLSTDARIAAETLGLDFPTEDMHDSNYANPDQAAEMGKFQNKTMHEVAATYHMQVEKLNAMMRSLDFWTRGEVKLSEEANKRILERLNQLQSKFYKDLPASDRPSLDQMIHDLTLNRYNMEMKKLETLDGYYAIHHYGAAGGEYVLTPEDAKLREKSRKELEADIAKGGKAYQRMHAVANGLSKIVDTGAQSVREGVGQTVPKTETVSFLEGKKDKPFRAGQLMGHLKGQVKSLAGKQLLGILEPLLPEGLTVNYFNDKNIPKHVADAKDMIERGAVAWFDPNTNQINILDTQSVNHKVTPETLMHELLHAGLRRATDMVADGKGTPAMQAAVKRLEVLRKDVIEAMNDTQRDRFKNALADVDELISWGMTNREFQNFLIKTPVSRGKRTITSMFKDFVTNALDLVFGTAQRSAQRKNIPAYEALVMDVGTIAQELHQMKDTVDPELKKQISPMIQARINAKKHVQNLGTRDLFDSLDGGNTSREFNERGRQLIESVVDTVLARKDRQSLVEDLNQQSTHSVAARDAGFALSDREAYLAEAIEVTVEAALDNGAGSNIYKVFTAVHDEARKNLSPQSFFNGDWSTATAQDKALAQAKYDYLFKPNTSQGKNSMISRFAGMALGSEAFHKMLDFTVPGKPKEEKTPLGKITDAIDYVIAWTMNWLAGIKQTDKLNDKVENLAERMTSLDQLSRSKVMAKYEKQYYRFYAALGKVNTLTGTVVEKLGNSDRLRNSNNRVLSTIGKAARVATSKKANELPQFYKDMRNYEKPNTRYGVIAETLREFEGAEGFTKAVHKLLRGTKEIEKARTQQKTVVKNLVDKSFATKLTAGQHKGLAYGLLRSGAHVLTGDYSTEQIRDMIGQDKARKDAIDKLSNEIKAHPDYRGRMIIRAKQLGLFTQTGNPTPGLVPNALAIVQGVGSPTFKGEQKAADPDLVKKIDQLATLYAFEYMDHDNRKELLGVMTNEIRRTDTKNNGIETLLGTHRNLHQVSADVLFAENPLSAIKGWMPEITNPYVQIRVESVAAKQDLEAKGWKMVTEVKADAADLNQGKYAIYRMSNGGNQRRVSGVLSLTDTHTKGMTISDGATGDFTGTIKANLEDLVRKNERIDPDQYDPRKDFSTQLFANFDTEGNVMNYSYRMNANTRDSLLERNHSVGDLLGEFAGKSFDKMHSPDQNKRTIDALRADFSLNYSKNPNAYVAIGPKVSDPGARELWRLLPYDTRKYMADVWGKDKPMYVRNDLISTVFGYKKISMGNLWNKSKEERNAIEKTYGVIVEGMFGKKAQLAAYRIGTGVSELVSTAKDWIVIRTADVLIQNIKANCVSLFAWGVAPTAIARDTAVAFRAGKAYRENMSELMEIEHKMRSGIGNQAELEHRYAQLQDALARNPLREFIESGTMPSIVDDIEATQDDYGYKSLMAKKMEPLTNHIPDWMKTVGKTAVLSQGTIGHNLMSAATQYSDFTARYVLYNHLRTREKMSHDDAVHEAMQLFINYDLPSSPQVQWLNDTGLLMFTKFLFRFQHVMLKILNRNPAYVMSQSFMLHALTDTETVLDPNLLNKGMGIFHPGPMALPSAIGGSTPMNLVF